VETAQTLFDPCGGAAAGGDPPAVFTGHFSDEVLRSPQILWTYLQRIAENKVRDAERKYRGFQRYNICHDVPLEELAADDCLAADGLSPQELAWLKECVEEKLVRLVEQLPRMLQFIIRRLLEGHLACDIAKELGIEVKRVYRAIAWLQKKTCE
jgi:DNA-directed RNA polymerase specialized sigma24 family protein